MKAVIYSRVSTEEQTVENQVRVLKELATQRGFELVRIYQEEASAWKAGHQKELAHLLEDARRGKFQVVLVWALDRLTREGAVKQIILWHKLAGYGVKLISYQQPYTEIPNELTPVILAIFGYIAQQESAMRSERTKAGLNRARAEGKKLGRPKKHSVPVESPKTRNHLSKLRDRVKRIEKELDTYEKGD